MRLQYHYQDVLRQDLLLKCSQSPELLKMTITAQVPYESIKKKLLALELLCGQKVVSFERKQFRFQKVTNCSIRVNLRGLTLFNFLDKLITFCCFQDLQIDIHHNIVNMKIPSNIIRLFPEIQNHLDLVMLYDLDIKIETSAKNEQETLLLWTGFHSWATLR